MEAGAVGECTGGANDILGRVRTNVEVARRTDDSSDACEEATQTLVDLGQRGHVCRRGRSRASDVAANGDGGRDVRDAIGVRSLDPFEVLARRRRKALDVPPLPFREERVECEAALPRATHTRQHDKLPERDVEIDCLEVVDSHAPQFDATSGDGGWWRPVQNRRHDNRSEVTFSTRLAELSLGSSVELREVE